MDNQIPEERPDQMSIDKKEKNDGGTCSLMDFVEEEEEEERTKIYTNKKCQENKRKRWEIKRRTSLKSNKKRS